jgi:hypothetical protein
MGILPDLSDEEVQDRSKADTIAKLLVCYQLVYFVVQVVARPFSGLPVTLLEVHVLIHIVCTIILYVIWFKKPYDVKSPYLCRDQRVVDVAALFVLTDVEVRWGPRANVQRDTIKMENVLAKTSLPAADPRCVEHLRAAKRAVKFLKNHGSKLGWTFEDDSDAISFDQEYVTKWSSDYKMIGSVCESGSTDRGEKKYEINSFIIGGLSIIYGASHLVAWNFEFPTKLEMWLWRASGLSCIVFPIGFLSEGYLSNQWRRQDEDSRLMGAMKSTADWIQIISLFMIPTCIWPFARAFLLGEVCASLRSPAPGTYEVVQWTKFMPHIS